MTTPRPSPVAGAWKRRLRRELSWLLLGKLAALIVLWALFFSPAHRLPVDGSRAGAQLGVGPAPTGAAATPASHRGPRSD